MQKIKTVLATKNKLIKSAKHIRLTKKSAVIAGIAGIFTLLTASMVSVLLYSQQNPKSATSNEAAPNRIGTTQGSSETAMPNWDLTIPSIVPPMENTTVPSIPATVPGTATTSREALTTPSIMPPIQNATVPDIPATIPRTATTSREALTTPSIMPPIDNATVANIPATFPETATTSRGALTTHNTTTTPNNFRAPSRFSATLNSTLSSNRITTTPNITNQPSETFITPSSTTTSSTLFKAKPATRTSIAASLARVQETKYSEQTIDDASATALGLLVANREGQIKPYSRTWKKTQDAISLLRQGKTRQESARRAGISMSVLAQLIEWGQKRP